MSFTVVICSGAWPLVQFFDPLVQAFASKGYEAICKVPPSYLTYSPKSPPEVNPDTTYLRSYVLDPLLKEEKDIVLFMHSYGGAYDPGSLEGISKKAREANGLKGGIVASIFNAAFVAPKGTTPLQAMHLDPENLPEWIDYDKSTGLVAFKKAYAKAMLYHDLPDEEGERLADMLPKQPYACFSTPTHWDPFHDPNFAGKFGYIFTEADRIVPMEAQRGYARIAEIDTTFLLKDSSHSPHIERPEELAGVVLGMVSTIMNKAS